MQPPLGSETAFCRFGEVEDGARVGCSPCPICGSGHSRLFRTHVADLKYFCHPTSRLRHPQTWWLRVGVPESASLRIGASTVLSQRLEVVLDGGTSGLKCPPQDPEDPDERHRGEGNGGQSGA
jgi:hypothetical protein